MARLILFTLLIAFFLNCSALVSAVDLTSTGSTLALDGVPYYIPSTAYTSISNFQSQILTGSSTTFDGLVPVTVVDADAASFNLQQLGQTISSFGSDDDVWGEGFLSST